MDEYESLSHSKWSANIMLYSFQNAGGRHFLRGVETAPRRGV